MNRTFRFTLGVVTLLLIGFVFAFIYTWQPARSDISHAASLVPLSMSGAATPMPSSVSADGSDDQDRGTTPQTGAPAIQPRFPEAGPRAPAFTEDDVRQFALRASDGFGRIRSSQGAPQLSTIEFMTAQAVRERLREPINLEIADQTLICYVEYSGSFTVQSPMGSTLHYDHVAQVFDAHSGNILMQTAFND
jgi:hypothetical protein